MTVLSDLIAEVEPVHERLFETLEKIPDATLEAEQARLRERFLDIGSRIIAIDQIRSAE